MVQKHVNLVDLVKSFPTNIYLQNLASIQKRTSPVKFAHLAEKSGKGSISNLSTPRSNLLARCTALEHLSLFGCEDVADEVVTAAGALPSMTELKGSIGEGPNHSNHSNRSNSFKIGIFRNFP